MCQTLVEYVKLHVVVFYLMVLWRHVGKQLLTLNTSTSSSITFNFKGLINYVGIVAMEVVVFSCSMRAIGVTSSISIRGDGN